ncbi:flagellar motor switch protein FliN [Pusillimonas sp. CC-YST705]|uniref:Flagellar motor switch protein FliN n=1 Tax=Mesopusillimonas faecipullorum TaxID=2755040 RepID=A0ABS8CB29_9BURK|nr:flagellar motor switch protein FliN [Mesopusillimonas faecipullorum]MCB5362829.1 flagellar motor switch protein FliN [Mesopusillimonas faecipullorum]
MSDITDPDKKTDADPADDWAAALSEQNANPPPSQADGLKGVDDDWARAMAEQAASNAAPSPSPAPAPGVFQPLVDIGQSATSDIDLILDIPVQLSVELGRTRMTIKNILQLGQGSVIELDGLAGEPMDIYVNGYLIAQGEVVVVDDRYGIRLTDIITPADRLNRLNSRR